MASQGSSNSSVNILEIREENENKPLWKYVTRLDKTAGGGENWEFQYKFCNAIFKGLYTRVKAYLIKLTGKGISVCKKVTNKNLVEMQNAIDEAELKSLNSQPKKVPLPPSVSLGSMSHYQGEAKRRRTSDASGSGNMSGGAIGKAFNIKERDHLMVEIARMFYSAGLPFHLARNTYFVSAFSYAATHNIPVFVPPGYNLLRTTLLQRKKANIDNLLANINNLLQPIKSTWEQNGVSIVSDGWSDSQRRPLINFMAVSGGGPMFLKAVDCSGEIKDKYFIANLMKEVIHEVGPQHVIQIITDNGPNCKAAGQLIETQFPHILWTSCVVHTLNLALKNICAAKHVENNETTYSECSWISEIAGDCTIIKHFITNHSMRLAMYKEFVSLKLLKQDLPPQLLCLRDLS
ncbi:uncharacterized protein LOC130794414 isoform X1 [Actinidia eriantha]|uniref:uncharacterized protein LOC130794414 isoform X1 n=1 Tax=Actinidia eriantha TaxID=165200 RepID=UPI00258F2F42|nr:uncharacterized protein LOC130794414 isoform X1 [Actinidia eriantha]